MLTGSEFDDYLKEAYSKHYFRCLEYKYCIELNRIKPFTDNLNRKWKISLENKNTIYVSRLELRKDNTSNFEQLLRNLKGYYNIIDYEILPEDIFLNIKELTKNYRV